MLRVALRAAAVALALLAIAAGGASPALAADPTVGGRLSTAGGGEVAILNQGSLPARVTVTADVVTVTVDPFILAPGETRTVQYTGAPIGHIYANLVGLFPATGTDANAVTLGLTLRAYAPPMDWRPVLVIGFALLCAFLIIRRLRRYTFRVERRRP